MAAANIVLLHKGIPHLFSVATDGHYRNLNTIIEDCADLVRSQPTRPPKQTFFSLILRYDAEFNYLIDFDNHLIRAYCQIPMVWSTIFSIKDVLTKFYAEEMDFRAYKHTAPKSWHLQPRAWLNRELDITAIVAGRGEFWECFNQVGRRWQYLTANAKRKALEALPPIIGLSFKADAVLDGFETLTPISLIRHGVWFTDPATGLDTLVSIKKLPENQLDSIYGGLIKNFGSSTVGD